MSRLKLGILQVNHDRSVEVGDAFPDDAHRFRCELPVHIPGNAGDDGKGPRR